MMFINNHKPFTVRMLHCAGPFANCSKVIVGMRIKNRASPRIIRWLSVELSSFCRLHSAAAHNSVDSKMVIYCIEKSKHSYVSKLNTSDNSHY